MNQEARKPGRNPAILFSGFLIFFLELVKKTRGMLGFSQQFFFATSFSWWSPCQAVSQPAQELC